MKWAFIFKSAQCSPEEQNAEITYRDRIFNVYGVETVEAGCDLAKKLVDDGYMLLELCGGFGEEGCRKIIEAIDGRVPVGYIAYFPEEIPKLSIIIS